MSEKLMSNKKIGLTFKFWYMNLYMEAPPGFEPGNKGFADLCLTTWLRRHYEPLTYTDFKKYQRVKVS